MIRIFLFALFGLALGATHAQQEIHPKVDYFGYVEGYYAYDFNEPFDHIRQPFLFNYNRHNTFSVNQAVFSLKIDGGFYRGNVGFQAGTYPQDNFGETEDLLQHIFQANVGVSLNEKRTLWVDAGIYPSHLGYESSIGIENYTLTRSLAAENSPYFLAGVKMTYTPDEHWTLMATINNGWQRITREPGNQFPGMGTMVEYQNGDHLIHWGTLVSNSYPEAIKRIRFFNDLFYRWKVNEKLTITNLFDLGVEEKGNGESGSSAWFTYHIAGTYHWRDRWKLGFRFEVYQSDDPVVSIDQLGDGPQLVGGSANIDFQVNRFFIFRFEPRYLYGNDSFVRGSEVVSSDLTLTTSMAVRF